MDPLVSSIPSLVSSSLDYLSPLKFQTTAWFHSHWIQYSLLGSTGLFHIPTSYYTERIFVLDTFFFFFFFWQVNVLDTCNDKSKDFKKSVRKWRICSLFTASFSVYCLNLRAKRFLLYRFWNKDCYYTGFTISGEKEVKQCELWNKSLLEISWWAIEGFVPVLGFL